MKYMLLIYTDPTAYVAMPEEQQKAMFQEYYTVTEEMDKNKVHSSGAPLQPVNTATTVRVRNGKTVTSDGPFAETKEVLVGYYILDCKNLDEALGYAAKIPDARIGSVEIRPVAQM